MTLSADNEGPDQTALMRSLIWAFVVRACPEGAFSLGATYITARKVFTNRMSPEIKPCRAILAPYTKCYHFQGSFCVRYVIYLRSIQFSNPNRTKSGYYDFTLEDYVCVRSFVRPCVRPRTLTSVRPSVRSLSM